MSNLRGLTHVLTCDEEVRQPFTVVVTGGVPEVLSSLRIARDTTEELCGGLRLEIKARPGAEGAVRLLLPITNNTDSLWRGTVTLEIGKTSIPIDIGEIPSGETARDSIELDLGDGTTEVSGTLLIGP